MSCDNGTKCHSMYRNHLELTPVPSLHAKFWTPYEYLQDRSTPSLAFLKSMDHQRIIFRPPQPRVPKRAMSATYFLNTLGRPLGEKTIQLQGDLRTDCLLTVFTLLLCEVIPQIHHIFLKKSGHGWISTKKSSSGHLLVVGQSMLKGKKLFMLFSWLGPSQG